jgi:hypothetical protein
MKAALALILFASTSVAASAQAPEPPKPADPKVNAIAAIQLDFKARIDQYLSVRNKVKGDAPPQKQTHDPREIKAGTNGLAEVIRSARRDAKPGDIFTPEIQATFRKLLAPELKGEDGAHAKEILKDDAPSSVPLKVNAKYPEGKTFPTVPANLLINLPKLPPEVEYRIIGKNLILRDTEADIIVDYMTNAIK